MLAIVRFRIYLSLKVYRMKKTGLILLSILLTTALVNAQSLPDSLAKQVDLLFQKYATPNTPGCVVGIVRHDSLLYAKGYGLADLEHQVPNTPESIYYMCSVSKQLTGYAIALLARQGKLKLDDDMHIYLPWMPDFGHRISVRNLLNHTSGIRDDIGLAVIAGLPPDGMLTQELALELLKKQRTLNFPPGEKFSYSNSNYVLLAEIVRAVSGESFRSFTSGHIFQPLGMTVSRFIDDNQELVTNRVASYTSGDGKLFKNSYQNVYTLGDGGLFTSVADMAHWVMNFYEPRAGDMQTIALLTEKGRLNDGREIPYASGINVNTSRGWVQYVHNGGLAGFRTIIAVYPELRTGFIVFGNSGNNDIYGEINQLATLFIPDKRQKTAASPTMRRDSAVAELKTPDEFQRLTGNYIAENGYRLRFEIRDKRLWLNGTTLLVNDSALHFSPLSNPAVHYDFHQTAVAVGVSLYSPALSRPIYLERTKDVNPSDQLLQGYTGTYTCPELDCQYRIEFRDHQLYFTNAAHLPAKITLLGTDHLLSDGGLDHVVVIRDKKGRISGFELNSGEMMHLRFARTSP